MITGIAVDQAQSGEYYRRGLWTKNTLLDYWNDQVSQRGLQECACDDLGARYTYAELDACASKLAAWLVEVGVRPGDVVSFQLPPWAEFCVVFIACLKVGAICHPLSVTFNGADLVYALNLVESKAFICPTFHHKTDFEAQILGVVGSVPTLSLGAIAVHDKLRPSHTTTTLGQIFAGHEPYQGSPGAAADDIALILMTSGTTGRPKAALFTHNSLAFSAHTYIQRLGLGASDVMFMPAPLNHATGFKFGIIAPLLMGGRIVLQHEFSPREAIQQINEEGVTFSMGATPFLFDLFNCAEEHELSFGNMHLYVCGGAAVPSSMVKRAHAHDIALCECYGSTESSPHVIVPPAKCLEWDGCCSGIACDGIEVKVVDAQGRDVPFGELGEELSRGPQMFSGYWGNPEATAADLTEDGWFYSGDLCCMDELGRIRIRGRKKEILIRGGENISVNEVDEHLVGCPGIGAHATVGLPDERMGERICTFIVQEGKVAPTLESIAAYLDSKGVAKRLRPEHLEFIDAIPMTDSGKVKRHELSRELERRLAAR